MTWWEGLYLLTGIGCAWYVYEPGEYKTAWERLGLVVLAAAWLPLIVVATVAGVIEASCRTRRPHINCTRKVLGE